jgi:hypothetical protein
MKMNAGYRAAPQKSFAGTALRLDCSVQTSAALALANQCEPDQRRLDWTSIRPLASCRPPTEIAERKWRK